MSSDMPNPFRRGGDAQRPEPPRLGGTMMPNPFRQGSSRVPPQGITPKQWIVLYVLTGILVLVIGAMIYFKGVAESGGKKTPPGPGEVDDGVEGGASGAVVGEKQKPEEPPIKEVDVAPLPQEGEVSLRDLAASFKDGQKKPVKETAEFINMLNAVANSFTSEEFSKKVTPGLTAETAFKAPDKHRGEVLRCKGRLIYLYPAERIHATTPENLKYVYLGIMEEKVTGWKGQTIYFYMPDLPRDANGKPLAFESYRKDGKEIFTDWVEVEGVFLRQYLYPSQWKTDKGETVLAQAALMFVKNLKIIEKPEAADPRVEFVFIVAGIGLLLAGIVVVGGILSRKHSSGSLRMKLFAAKREKMAGKGVFPEPSPEKQVLGDEIPKPSDPGENPPSGS